MDYPKLNIKELPKLVSIVTQAADDESYLDPSNCPYDEGTIRLIKDVLDSAKKGIIIDHTTPERGKVGRPSKQVTIPLDEVEKEVDEIRKELADLKIEGRTMETSDRIQIIKTRAALIERVIGMKERVGTLKEYHNFIQVVISIMEEHLDPKIREKVLSELKKHAER